MQSPLLDQASRRGHRAIRHDREREATIFQFGVPAGPCAVRAGSQGAQGDSLFHHHSRLIGTPLSAPGSDTRIKEAIQSIVGAANRTGVSIYVVRMDEGSGDVGGVLNSYSNMSAGSSNPSPIAAPSAKGGSSNSPNSNGYNMAVAGQFASASEFRYLASRQGESDPVPGTLDSLVRGTAGYSFSKDDNFSAPVNELIFDLTTYYEASYVRSSSINDGSFHPVVVKPVRSGLKVRSGVGYAALPSQASSTQPAQP